MLYSSIFTAGISPDYSLFMKDQKGSIYQALGIKKTDWETRITVKNIENGKILYDVQKQLLTPLKGIVGFVKSIPKNPNFSHININIIEGDKIVSKRIKFLYSSIIAENTYAFVTDSAVYICNLISK